MIWLGEHTEKAMISPYQKPRLEFKQEMLSDRGEVFALRCGVLSNRHTRDAAMAQWVPGLLWASTHGL